MRDERGDLLQLLTGREAGEMLSAAVEASGGRLLGWRPTHVEHRPGRATVSFRTSVQWHGSSVVHTETLCATAGEPPPAPAPTPPTAPTAPTDPVRSVHERTLIVASSASTGSGARLRMTWLLLTTERRSSGASSGAVPVTVLLTRLGTGRPGFPHTGRLVRCPVRCSRPTGRRDGTLHVDTELELGDIRDLRLHRAIDPGVDPLCLRQVRRTRGADPGMVPPRRDDSTVRLWRGRETYRWELAENPIISRAAEEICFVKLYSDVSGQRFGQLVGDLMLVGWIWLCVELGRLVFRITNALGAPGRKTAEAGDGLANDLRKLSEPIGKVPAVGDELRSPVDGAAAAAGRMAQAGRDQAHAVEQLAYVLAGVTIGLPVLFAMLIWLPRRIRFSRRATAAQKFIDSAADLDLFALRAMANQPMHRLAKISDDPVGAWRDGDTEVIARLADLELRSTGLRAPS